MDYLLRNTPPLNHWYLGDCHTCINQLQVAGYVLRCSEPFAKSLKSLANVQKIKHFSHVFIEKITID